MDKIEIEMNKRNFELRKLCTKDLFPMLKIVSKIGVGEFRKCFDSINAQTLTSAGEIDVKAIGIGVILEAADILLNNIGGCEKDIYSLLADLSGMNAKDISELDMTVFVEMITQLVSKEEFKDFFMAVSKLIPKTK